MVSVLINNHNYGRYIGEAIESVMNQTYQDFELIIVEGDSNDNSREVIMEYCKKYPDKITICFKPTSGQAAAFNVGFALSKGDIIAFLDSDDYWYSTKLETIVKLHETYAFIGHPGVSENTTVVKSPVVRFSELHQEERPALLRKYGFTDTYALTSSGISCRRELLEKILPMPEDMYVTCADHYVKLMALYYDNIKLIEDKLFYYRLHQSNAMLNNDEIDKWFVPTLDYNGIERINKKLKERGETAIPHINTLSYKDVLEVIGHNFKINKDENYVIYGTGAYGKRCKRLMDKWGARVIYYADSNKALWGDWVDGVKILSPESLKEKRLEYEKVLIASTWYKEIIQSLINLGMQDEDFMYSDIGINFEYFVGE